MKEGQGIETFSNGNRYEGEYVKDDFEGHGVLTWFNGCKYIGQFKNGKKEG